MFMFILTSISCEELFEETDCDANFEYYMDSWVDVIVLEKGVPVVGATVWYSYTKHYCDKHKEDYYQKYSSITNSNGYAKHKYELGFNLHNEHDYVYIDVWYNGKTYERTIDSRDFKGVTRMVFPIEVAFNF